MDRLFFEKLFTGSYIREGQQPFEPHLRHLWQIFYPKSPIPTTHQGWFMKTLVVYYTRTGNSKFAAETIAAELGADIEEVVDLKKRQGRLAFLPNGRDAMQGKETQIAEAKRTPNDYD